MMMMMMMVVGRAKLRSWGPVFLIAFPFSRHFDIFSPIILRCEDSQRVWGAHLIARGRTWSHARRAPHMLPHGAHVFSRNLARG